MALARKADGLIAPHLHERGLAQLLERNHYFIVGANSGGDAVAQFLESRGKRVEAFADLDSARCGSTWQDKPILSLDSLSKQVRADGAIVIGSFRHAEIARRLVQELHVDPETIFPYVNDMFARHYEPDLYRAHAGAIARVRNLLGDDDSRAYFDRVLEFYRTLNPLLLTPQPKAYGPYGYRSPAAAIKAGAFIVDVGAFDGDTCAFYLDETQGQCTILAIEAYLPNLIRLLHNFGSDIRIKPLHLALGSNTGALTLDGNPDIADACAHVSANAASFRSMDIVLCETLDHLRTNHLKGRIDVLKIDVEGADLDVLLGAAATVRHDRPALALASYHRPEHIWEIPLKAAELLGDCHVFAAHDPKWVHQIHYLILPR